VSAGIEAAPGDLDVPMLELTFTVDDNSPTSPWRSATPAGPSDTAAVSAWIDVDPPGFDPTVDTFVVEDTDLSDGVVLPVAQTVSTGFPLVMFLACDIDAGAVADDSHTVGVEITSPADIATPDAIDLTTSGRSRSVNQTLDA
jgi:hypothetical protein